MQKVGNGAQVTFSERLFGLSKMNWYLNVVHDLKKSLKNNIKKL